jgi:hypothetical protein
VVADRVRRDHAREEDCESACLLQQACRKATFGDAVTVDVKRLSRAEQLADRVRQLREQGVLWKDIRKLLRCGHQTAKFGLALGEV